MKYVVIAGLLFAQTGLTTKTAQAAGWSTTDRSVVAMGTGGAGTARADDPAAGAYNPAALAMYPGLSASLGLVLASSALNAKGADFSTDTLRSLSVPPQANLRWTGDWLTLGASFSVPFGSKLDWPTDWPMRFDLQQARVQVLRTQAFAGVKLGWFSIAAGPFIDIGKLNLSRALNFIEAEGLTSVETTARGFGATVALFARPHKDLDMGLSYHSRSKLDFSGFADFSVPPEFLGRAQDQALTAKVTLPDRITAGALYRLGDSLELTADVELVLWNTIDQLVLDFEQEMMNDQVQPRNWRPTVVPRVGASWAALSFLKLRGGLYVDPSPVPQETVGPSSPDSTRVGLSLGAGLSYGVIRLDLGYQLVAFTGSKDAEGQISYGGLVHLFGASIAAHFAL